MPTRQPSDRAAHTAPLLRAISAGDSAASEQLLPLVYDELHVLAERMLGGERQGHTLQPTALVHEAWLRLAPGVSDWESRAHFVRVAARAMRRALVDHARARGADKRGGKLGRITLDEQLSGPGAGPEQLLAVHEALEQLEQVDPSLAQLVELKVFGGMNHPEIAKATDTSLRSVERSWRLARSWLIAHMEPGDER